MAQRLKAFAPTPEKKQKKFGQIHFINLRIHKLHLSIKKNTPESEAATISYIQYVKTRNSSNFT